MAGIIIFCWSLSPFVVVDTHKSAGVTVVVDGNPQRSERKSTNAQLDDEVIKSFLVAPNMDFTLNLWWVHFGG